VIDTHQQENIVEALEQQRLETRAQIEEVSVDMWGGFPEVVEKMFPNAVIVIDRFHVMKAVNEELNKIRRQAGILGGGSKFILFPKHGSRLNMVELKFSILSRQCLERRIPSIVELQQEIEAWQQQPNQNQATVNWRFSTVDARTKLSRLYPNPSLPSSLWQTTSFNAFSLSVLRLTFFQRHAS
jgi:transposase